MAFFATEKMDTPLSTFDFKRMALMLSLRDLAGRLLLRELDRLASDRSDFAFESTLSGRTYVGRLQRWKGSGYRIEIVYLRLVSPRLALRPIAARVKQGGHGVPRDDVLRRFARGWVNFEKVFRPLADVWAVYDNSGPRPFLVEKGP